MKKIVFVMLCVLTVLPLSPAKAASQDACAIWLCLPGGFPTGCSGAYSEFRHRIKKRKPPLPNLSSCTVDGKTDGHYQLGYEVWKPCESGYVLRERKDEWQQEAKCYKQSCAPEDYRNDDDFYCESYDAIKRVKPHYVKMWVDGDYLGQFFY